MKTNIARQVVQEHAQKRRYGLTDAEIEFFTKRQAIREYPECAALTIACFARSYPEAVTLITFLREIAQEKQEIQHTQVSQLAA